MKTKQRKVFERVVNPLLIKHLVSAQKNAKKIRYRYRGKSKTMSNGYVYNRPQSFCHMKFADTFSVYYR